MPKDLDPILARALAPDIALRQQSAAALAAELRTVAAVLDVRTGDAAAPSTLLPIDDTPDKNAAKLLWGGLLAAGGRGRPRLVAACQMSALARPSIPISATPNAQ